MNDIYFSQMKLDRKSTERKNSEWLTAKVSDKESIFIPIWKGDFFFLKNKEGVEELLTLKPQSSFIESLKSDKLVFNEHHYFLGNEEENNNAFIMVDLEGFYDDEDKVIKLLSLSQVTEVYQVGFRKSLHYVEQTTASILGYGRALISWHQSARFCGFCSSKTFSKEAGHSRQCTNDSCSKVFFPRTDPVVIMLVEYKEEGKAPLCLLAAHTRSPEHLVSTIAGFVDPGESLEQAVIRESYEEVGLQVENVQYIASQPWPFPHTLMVGFTAQAKSKNISIDKHELTSAEWFTVDEIKTFSEWGADGSSLQIPRKESISRYLIEDWLRKNS